MKSVYIKDLKKGLIIAGETFLIIDCNKAEDKNGKEYCKVVLGDKTGKVEAKIWADKLVGIDSALLNPGVLVSVSGKVDEYKGNPQVNIFDMQRVDESQMDDYMESSIYDADEMLSELMLEVEAITHKGLRKVIKTIITDEDLNRKYKFWPAGKSVHHDFRSGLIQHILEMIAISKGLKRFYPDVNYDILTAGILLHDIGKVEELGATPAGVEYSKKGVLLGHISLGLLLFTKYAEGNIPEDMYLHISHLILSHHGQLDYGSPVLPATIEAVMLSNIDNLSSKSRAVDSAIKKLADGEEFTDFNRWLGGIKLWKGGVFDDLNDDVKVVEVKDVVSDEKDQLSF